MKLVSLKHKGGPLRGGVLVGERVRLLTRSNGGDDVLRFIAAGASEDLLSGEEVPLEECSLCAPLQSPPRIFGIGLNYGDHAAESKMKVQEVPTVFLKLPSSITGPDTDVLLPSAGHTA